MDKWDRKTNFNCESCRYYVPKPNYGTNLGACRRRAPIMTGYPVVNSELDWCGEHKIGSNPVRDMKDASKKKVFVRYCPKHSHIVDPNCIHCQEFAKSQIEDARKQKVNLKSDFATETKFCTKCDNLWAAHIGKKFVREYFIQEDCPDCREKPLTEEAALKTIDELHDTTCCSDNQIKASIESDGNSSKDTITAIYPVDFEEKAKIKKEIIKITYEIRNVIQYTTDFPKTRLFVKPKFADLIKLLEKL